MKDLYPGKAKGDGFRVDGFARTYKTISPKSRPEHSGQVIAGFYSFGPKCFAVHQDNASPTPSFSFRPLTVGFLSNAIHYDAAFKFSLVQRRLGDVTHLSGAGARDTGEIRQGILSLHASGGWNPAGLKLHFLGELYENDAFLNRPTPDQYRQASYEIELDIPWAILRFMFYDAMHLVVENYRLHGTASS
jgi:hypothetical protein